MADMKKSRKIEHNHLNTDSSSLFMSFQRRILGYAQSTGI